MSTFRTSAYVLASVGLLTILGCGRPHVAADNPVDPNEPGDPTDTCSSRDDCDDGICVGGQCISGECVDDHGDDGCDDGKYCYFANPEDWEPGATGVCKGACTDDDDCGFGQSCAAAPAGSSPGRRCYSVIPCLHNNDCPPAEVCSDQLNTCGPPPAQCVFETDCPQNWICDNITSKCVDPEGIDLGGCETQSDCNGIDGCQGGRCTCDDGECKPNTCEDDGDCDEDAYCNDSVCVAAVACPSGQDKCTPYGMVCEDGYCKNPHPCSSTGTCPTGYTCNTAADPDACFPDGTNECTHDDLCPPGEYCEIFTGTCEVGCRGNADCAGMCGTTATNCNCNAEHECTGSSVSLPGSTCSHDSDCVGGTVCSFNDLENALACQLFPVGDCSKSCRVVCDLLTNALTNTCPAGQTCGGSDMMNAIIMQLFAAFMESDSASVCYPN